MILLLVDLILNARKQVVKPFALVYPIISEYLLHADLSASLVQSVLLIEHVRMKNVLILVLDLVERTHVALL